MRAPDPNTVVRLHRSPPAHMVQAGTAWRPTLPPRRPRRLRRSPWPSAAALAVCVALLGLFVWMLPGGEADVVRVTARVVGR
jgi:ferric-dicitrate binding protein FerR (iron transport regulator)